jgi:hypothetical protein
MVDEQLKKVAGFQGIENYAKKNHRIHPILEIFIRSIFSKGNLVSESADPQFYVSPEVELSILEYRGLLSLDFLESGQQRLQKSAGEDRRPKKIRKDISLPEDAIKHILAKIPAELRINVKFDLEAFIKSLKTVRIFIVPIKCLPSGRATSAKFSVNGNPVSIRGITPTPCFMFLNYMIWGTGNLNAEGEHCGNCFDLATPEGMSLFLHELYHIYQFYRNPFGLLKGYFHAIRDSLRFAGILFSHRHIGFELEAITFEHEIYRRLSQEPLRSKLKIFQRYR